MRFTSSKLFGYSELNNSTRAHNGQEPGIRSIDCCDVWITPVLLERRASEQLKQSLASQCSMFVIPKRSLKLRLMSKPLALSKLTGFLYRPSCRSRSTGCSLSIIMRACYGSGLLYRLTGSSGLARKEMVVVRSTIGDDEAEQMFAGFSHPCARAWTHLSMLPHAPKVLISKCVGAMTVSGEKLKQTGFSWVRLNEPERVLSANFSLSKYVIKLK